MRTGIRTIFERYSSNNQKYGQMKFSQFKDILTQAQIMPYFLNLEQVELYHQTKRRMNPHKNFMNQNPKTPKSDVQ